MTTTSVQPVFAAEDGDFAAARSICRHHARSLFFVSSFLPPRKRRAAFAVYAFARMTREALTQQHDEIAGAGGMRSHPSLIGAAGSSCCSGSGFDSILNMFRDRLDQIYSGQLELPIAASRSEAQRALAAFAQSVQEFDIPKPYFFDFAEGCRMQLSVARFPTWTSLQRYIDLIGGSIALAINGVLGSTHSDSASNALKMARAICLTNLLCDLGKDAEAGRVFLPLEDLARFRYSEKDLFNRVVNEPFRELMRFQVARARNFYAEAGKGICWLAGDGAKLAVSNLGVAYDALLKGIERRNYDVFSHPPAISRGMILRTLPAAWRLARRHPY